MSHGARILVVEDEPAIADTLVYALRTEGFVPDWRTTGRDSLAALADGRHALVVIDVGLPDMSGFDLCRTIRRGSQVPVIFLTARAGEIDRVLGLELGGDDYLVKPFSPRELTARVRAVLRRTDARGLAERAAESSADGGDSMPRLQIDVERCAASYGGARLELTRYEFRLLQVLASRPGRVFSREQLMALAWEEPEASLDRTVDAHVKTLRAKLRAAQADADPIQTHRGLGYSLREDA
jgi:two-component system catabolic regulation response regulator CreB